MTETEIIEGSLRAPKQKREHITENSPGYDSAEVASSPWGRAIIPLEMARVVAEYPSPLAGYPNRG